MSTGRRPAGNDGLYRLYLGSNAVQQVHTADLPKPHRKKGNNKMKYGYFSLFSAALLLVLPLSEVNAFGQARAVLTRHVREITRTGEAQPIGQLPADQIMNLDLVLPIRDQAGLEQFLKEVYDPASPSYRQFLTVSRFTERFGPSQEDYYALVRFAKQNGLTVVGGTRDGMEVRVTGPVSAVETAFHVSMR